MAGNNSIQILRGSQTYDLKTSTEVLQDGQPFYSKKTTEFFIGNGETPISGLKPVKALTDQTYNSDSDVAQSGRAVAEAITPMTDEAIDALFTEVVGIGDVPTVQHKQMNFGYYEVPANTKFTIKRNANYTVFCNSAAVKLYKSNGTSVIPNTNDSYSAAKQLQLITATLADNPDSTTFAVGGMVYTGNILNMSTVNRKADDGAYIIGTASFNVYEMVKGE